jgi:hypothetical protein
MSYGNAGLPRFHVRTDSLGDGERAFIASLSSSGKANARLLRMSDHTYAELMQPLGRVKPSTLARVRQRLAELGHGQA